MTELEKLEAGLEYCYDDPEVVARKEDQGYRKRYTIRGRTDQTYENSL